MKARLRAILKDETDFIFAQYKFTKVTSSDCEKDEMWKLSVNKKKTTIEISSEPINA